MKNSNTTFTIGTIGCILLSIVYIAIAILGLINGAFPLGYQIEAFTSNKIGTMILFLAAAAEVVTVIITQIVYNDFEKVSLISKSTMFTGMAFVALIFVFQQSIVPIILWVLGGATSVTTLSACSSIAKPDKPEKK